MTLPNIISDQLTDTIVELLSSPHDEKDALLPPPPVAAPASTPPLASDPAYVLNLYAPQPPRSPAPSAAIAGYTQSLYGVTPPSSPAPAFAGLAGYNAGLYGRDVPGSGYKSLYAGGYVPDGPVPKASGAQPDVHLQNDPREPYVFPVQHPKPGENRLLKSLESDYAAQHKAAINELHKRDDLKKEKDTKVVRYLNDQKREKYRVDVGAVMTRGGVPFDTHAVKLKYAGKSGQWMPEKRTYAQNLEWWNNSLIWVCVGDPKGSEKPRFFSHVGKPDRFHHSSFNRGGGVIGAGEWIIEEGALRKVSPTSGHYKPGMDYLYHAVLQLAVAFRDRAAAGGTTIFLFDTVDGQWIDYPVKEFIKAPTMGGRLSTHD